MALKAYRPMAAVAASAAAALMAAGCSGSSGGDEPKPMSAKRLDQASLGAKEVSGYQIERASAKSAAGAGGAEADRSECQPLAALLGSSPDPKPVRSVVNTFARTGDGKDYEGLQGMVRVAAYKGGGAKGTLADLRKAAESCASGFGMKTGEGEEQKFSAVQQLASPKLGDESAAYRLVNTSEKAPSLVAVVRTGSTLSMFFVTSLTEPQRVEMPQDLLKAQVEKVRKAEKGHATAPSSSDVEHGDAGEAGDSQDS
ncbi:hypothetical protein AB0I49_05805 [Streptomyces sp. NPDC050617]|uniref:hypothetical protein n=1 Tax=Streptomyces sp. NPDC050617 TaxID=3154628 RepID=UPI00341E9F1F